MDSAHGHPPPHHSPPVTLPSRLQSNRDHNVDLVCASPPTSARQQRLLRTRNARFPAKKLSISGISSRFSQLIKANETSPQTQPAPTRNQENPVYKTHKDYPLAAQSTQSLGILEEITNSIGVGVRSKSLSKRPPIPIFQDTPERALLDESPDVSPYQDQSSLINSPTPFDHIQDSLPSMGLRQISGNARKSYPSETPPLKDSFHGGRRRRSTQKSRFNSEEYIEHIERELELVKDAVYSPNTNRPWKEKLKSARAENERLRKEMNEVRLEFEAEVQRTVEHMTSTEIDLRRKIRSLEDELEDKEAVIHNIECQHEEKRLDQSTIDTLKATIDKLEGEKAHLEQDNESMSRRNEVLTQLLALSPTKSLQHFELGSPTRARVNPRPRSMMIPRMPSSPGTNRLSRPHSVLASPSGGASQYFSSRQSTLSTPPHRLSTDLSAEQVAPRSTRRSLAGSLSRRSTLTSEIDTSLSSLDLQQSQTDQPLKQNHKRRTRRFLHGSTQLKPLLLPTLTGDNGALYSASSASPGHQQRRGFSEEELDTTTTLLSQSPTQYELEPASYPFGIDMGSHSTQRSRQLAYQSLEGILDGQNSDENEAGLSSDWYLHALPSGNIDISVEDLWAESQPALDQWIQSSPRENERDLDATILPMAPTSDPPETTDEIAGLGIDSSPSPANRHSSIDVPEPLFSPINRSETSRLFASPNTKRMIAPPLTTPAPANAISVQTSRKRRKISSSSLQSEAALDANLVPDLPTTHPLFVENGVVLATPSHSRKSSSSRLSLTSPSRTKSPLEVIQRSGLGGAPLAAVTIKTIYGILSRYTTYMREIRRDPLALARTVIANAWHTHWQLMGRLSWWVLGLFLGQSMKDSEARAWDWDDYDGESIAERYCRRRSRELDGQHLALLPPFCGRSPARHVRFEEQYASYRTGGSSSPAGPALKGKPGWGESLLLWGKFSVAILMAVGGAVVKGPGEMMRDADRRDGAGRTSTAKERHIYSDNEPSAGFDEHVFPPPPISDLTTTRAVRRRLRNRSPSPPPSARMLPRSNRMDSPTAITSTSAFQFGLDHTFKFSSPTRDHDWEDEDLILNGRRRERTEEELDTLRPGIQGRQRLAGIFSSPLKEEPGGLSGVGCDPDSAGQGLDHFQKMDNVAIADPGGGGNGEYDDVSGV